MVSKRRLFAILLCFAVLLVNGSVGALAENVLSLPAALRIIEEEAFAGNTSIDRVVLPEGVRTINARAFSGSTLSEINLPASLEYIDPSAFDGTDGVLVRAEEGTYAYNWALDNGYIREPMVYPESSHPYPSNARQTWNYIHHENAAALKVVFNQNTAIAWTDDYLYITDSTGVERRYNGSYLAGRILTLPGHSFSLRLESNAWEEHWGFAIDDIFTVSHEDYEEYLDYVASHPYEMRDAGDGTGEITSYNGQDAVLNIPETIDGITVTAIGSQAFASNPTITRVTIPGTVKNICVDAFSDCSSLKEVTLGEGVLQIDYRAFINCKALTAITLPASLKSIASGAFDGTSLETVNAVPGTYAYTWAVANGYIVPVGDLVVLPFLEDGTLTESGDNMVWDLIAGNSYGLQLVTKVSDDTTLSYSGDWFSVKDEYWNDFDPDEDILSPGTSRLTLILDFNMTGATRQADITFTSGARTRTLTIRQLSFMLPDIVEPDDLDIDYSYFDDEGGASPAWVFYERGDLEFAWNTVDGAVGYAYDVRTPLNDEESEEDSFVPIPDASIHNGVIRVTVPADMLAPTNSMDHSVLLRVIDQYGHEYDTSYRFGIYDPASPEWGYKNHFDVNEETGEEFIDGVTITGYTGGSATPVVPSAIGNLPVVYIDGAFQNNTNITGVTLPVTLTGIGNNTFFGCSGLTALTIPDGVTELGSSAFSGCSSLTGITIPSGVTRLGYSLFNGCASLTEITIPDSVTAMDWNVFSGCTGLTGITIPGGIPEISSAFTGCTGLETVTVLPGVQRLSWSAFSGCSALTNVSLPASVYYIDGSAFDGCSSISEFIAPEGSYAYTWGIEHGYIHENYVFESAHPFTSDSPTDYSYDSHTSAAGLKLTFSAQTKFDNLSLTDGNGNIHYYYSRGPQGNNDLEGQTIIVDGSAFNIHMDYSGNQRFGFAIMTIEPMTAEELSAWKAAHPFLFRNYSYYDPGTNRTTEGLEITRYQGTDTDVMIPSTFEDKQVIRLGDSLFNSRPNLASVTVPEGVLEISYGVFDNCPNLTSLTLPGSLLNIYGETINGCGDLQITAPEGSYAWNWAVQHGFVDENAVLESVHPFFSEQPVVYQYTYPGEAEMLKVAFSGKTNFNSLTITLSDGSSQVYNGNQLAGRTLYLPDNSFTLTLGEVYESWGSTFYGFRITDVSPMSVAEYEAYRSEHPFATQSNGGGVTITSYIGTATELVIPEYYEGSRVTGIGENAFLNQTALASVVIPDSVNNIFSAAFRGCTSLVSVTLPSTLQSVNSNLFYNCNALTNISIPDSVRWIYNNVFSYCALTTLHLSANVEYIDDNAFYNCPNLIIDAPENSYAQSWAVEHGFVRENVVLESAHPFRAESASGERFSYTHDTDAAALKVTFSSRSVFDNLTLTDAQGSSMYFSGSDLAGKDVVVQGNAFTILMESWGSLESFGFRITAVEALTESEYNAYRAEHPFMTGDYNGDNLTITGYIGLDTDLVIPQYIDGMRVQQLGSRAFAGNARLTSVVIPEGIEDVGPEVFRDCTSLASAVLPSTLSSLGHDMFSGCTSLTDVTVPEGVQRISGYAFNNCASLKTIALPQSVNHIDEVAFAGCVGQLLIIAPEGSYAWSWARDHSFDECAVLESAHPIGSHEGFESLYTHDGPAVALKVTFSEKTDGSVIRIWIDDISDGMRYSGSQLAGTTIVIPDDHFTIYIDDSYGCFGFRVTEIEPMTRQEYEDYLAGHPFLTTPLDDGVMITGYRGSDNNLVIPSTIDGWPVRGLSAEAFAEHNELTSVVIPEGVCSAGESVFRDCEGLTSVLLPGTLTTISRGMFTGCYELTNVSIPEGVESIEGTAFNNCASLTDVTLPQSIGFIDGSAFKDCHSLVIDASVGSYAYRWAIENDFAGAEGVLESAHPYMDLFASEPFIEYPYTYDGEADMLQVTFSPRTSFYSATITDANGGQQTFANDDLAGVTLSLPGNSFTITLSWDPYFLSSMFGFRITEVTPTTTIG